MPEINFAASLSRLFHGEYVFVLEDGTRLASGRRYGTRIKSCFSKF